jgi:uncharacterized membrane protein
MFGKKNRAIAYGQRRNAIIAMIESVIPHFGIGWRAFKSHSSVFVISMFVLFASWVVLEVAVVALQRFGLVVWLVLHLAFFVLFSGLMAGLHRIALETVQGETPRLANLTALLGRGPTFLLASCIYFVAVAGGLTLLVVPGIYVAVRYAFFGQVVARRSTSALTALRDAAALSEGRWWTLCVFLVLILLLNLAGAAVLGVGLLITFPVSLLATSDLYWSLRQPAKP